MTQTQLHTPPYNLVSGRLYSLRDLMPTVAERFYPEEIVVVIYEPEPVLSRIAAHGFPIDYLSERLERSSVLMLTFDDYALAAEICTLMPREQTLAQLYYHGRLDASNDS